MHSLLSRQVDSHDPHISWRLARQSSPKEKKYVGARAAARPALSMLQATLVARIEHALRDLGCAHP